MTALAIQQSHLSALLLGFPGSYILRQSVLVIVKSFNDLTRSWLLCTNKEADYVKGRRYEARLFLKIYFGLYEQQGAKTTYRLFLLLPHGYFFCLTAIFRLAYSTPR